MVILIICKLSSFFQDTGGRYGLKVPIYLLRGSKNNKLPVAFRNNCQYGTGKLHAERTWMALGWYTI